MGTEGDAARSRRPRAAGETSDLGHPWTVDKPPRMTHERRIRGLLRPRTRHALSVLGAFSLGIVGAGWLTQWLAGHDVFYLSLVPGYVTVVLVHELGHAVAGLLVGYWVPFLYMGPVRVEWLREGGARISANKRLGLWGGAVLVLPRTHPRPSELATYRRRMVAVFAAGPAASLLVGGVALVIALFLLPSSARPFGEELTWLELLSLMSIAVGIGQVVPIRIGNQRSDGLRILSLLRSRAGQDQTLLDAMVTANVDGVRPRDWPLPPPEEVEAITDLGTLMLIYYALLDRGRQAEAWELLAHGTHEAGGRNAGAWRAVRDLEHCYMSAWYLKNGATLPPPVDVPPSHRHILELSLARARAALMVEQGNVSEALACADSVARFRALPTSSGLTRFNLSALDEVLGRKDEA